MNQLAFVLMMLSCTSLAVMPVTANDYTLGIFGNANMDGTIDEDDIAYVEGIIDGTKEKTKLADANYDSEIDEDDITQIELIIMGEEKELTIIDSLEEIVTVKKPVQRIVPFIPAEYETLRSLKVSTDKIVGITSIGQFWDDPLLFPELADVPRVGTKGDPDIEAILNLYPDVVILPLSEDIKEKLEAAGITVLAFACYGEETDPTYYSDEVKKLGYIFDKEMEAEEFIGWYEGIINMIQDEVAKIPEEDKPKVYFEHYSAYSTREGYADRIAQAGGIDIFEEYPGRDFDPEAVIVRDPDIIIKLVREEVCGYRLDRDDVSGMKEAIEEVRDRPELQRVPAVKNKTVCAWGSAINMAYSGPNGARRQFLLPVYWAKWFHPDIFKDLNPTAIHQEYLTRFQGLDIDLNEKGVFAYPEPS
jgi:iron complex transport system substrate-binding protein